MTKAKNVAVALFVVAGVVSFIVAARPPAMVVNGLLVAGGILVASLLREEA